MAGVANVKGCIGVVASEQLLLCEDWLEDPLRAARERLMDLQGSRHAPRTELAYAADWRHFLGWCESKRRSPLPAEPDTVALYIADQVPLFAPSTLERRTAAVASYHIRAGYESPVGSVVREVIAGMRRQSAGKVKRMAAITPDELLLVLEQVGEGDDERERSNRVARDRAALLLAFAGAFRRSEVQTLQLADVELSSARVQVTLGRSKTDQQARGRVLVLPRAKRAGLCCVRMLAAWLKCRGESPGPLFCEISHRDEVRLDAVMQSHSLYYALRQGAQRAGLDATKYGAHSLRAGFVTAAADAGADIFAIMEITGHRSVETVGKYVRRSVHRYPLAKLL